MFREHVGASRHDCIRHVFDSALAVVDMLSMTVAEGTDRGASKPRPRGNELPSDRQVMRMRQNDDDANWLDSRIVSC
jgi:hypothetical protein